MIGALIDQTGMGRKAVIAIGAALIVLSIAVAVAAGLMAYRGALADARQSGRTERDAHWKAEIAESNAKVAAAQLAAERAASEASARLAAERAALNDTIARLEAENARLPNAGARGLDRDRVRLLPR
jgi:hypothetical protein